MEQRKLARIELKFGLNVDYEPHLLTRVNSYKSHGNNRKKKENISVKLLSKYLGRYTEWYGRKEYVRVRYSTVWVGMCN